MPLKAVDEGVGVNSTACLRVLVFALPSRSLLVLPSSTPLPACLAPITAVLGAGQNSEILRMGSTALSSKTHTDSLPPDLISYSSGAIIFPVPFTRSHGFGSCPPPPPSFPRASHFPRIHLLLESNSCHFLCTALWPDTRILSTCMSFHLDLTR